MKREVEVCPESRLLHQGDGLFPVPSRDEGEMTRDTARWGVDRAVRPRVLTIRVFRATARAAKRRHDKADRDWPLRPKRSRNPLLSALPRRRAATGNLAHHRLFEAEWYSSLCSFDFFTLLTLNKRGVPAFEPERRTPSLVSKRHRRIHACGSP
jgi:hypothetical protein